MNIFKQTKEYVTTRQAAEGYGIHILRNGMACCPFHPDRHPSMKVDRLYHCFACGVGGDVIDFTARLFNLSQYEAAKKLITDYNLPVSVDTKQNRNIIVKDNKVKQRKRMESLRQKLDAWLDYALDILIRYMEWIQFWKEFYKPEIDEEWHELFTEALENEYKINDYLDVLLYGKGEKLANFIRKSGRR